MWVPKELDTNFILKKEKKSPTKCLDLYLFSSLYKQRFVQEQSDQVKPLCIRLPLSSIPMAPVPLSPVKVGHIDDVQELRNAKPTTIPERFVRDMTERPTLATALSSTSVLVSMIVPSILAWGYCTIHDCTFYTCIPRKYRRYNHGQYSKHYVTSKLQGKKALDFAKIHTKISNQEGPLSPYLGIPIIKLCIKGII